MTSQWQDDLKKIWEEIRSALLYIRGDWLRDRVSEISSFYLTREQQKRLERKGRVGRVLYLSGWVLKGMVSRLSPARAVALVVGLLFLVGIVPWGSSRDLPIVGGVLILGVLMLELKDKLLATDELKGGRAIQIALMPEESPVIPGWTVWISSSPANDVGGDLVDVQQLDAHTCSLALGDVAGKGLPAALMMAKLQAILRALAPETRVLPHLAQRINEVLCRDGVASSFASLVYLQVPSGGDAVRWINAGHLPPVLVSREGAAQLPRGGMALGLKTGVRYREQSVQLAPGDLLVVYSDGLTEAIDRNGRFFGTARAMRLFEGLHGRPAGVAAKIITDELMAFLDGTALTDDFSLLVLSRSDEV